jgi:integrase
MQKAKPTAMERRAGRVDVRPVRSPYLDTPVGTASYSAPISSEGSPATAIRHLFRDAAATSLARLSPQDAKLIRALLGHQSFGVAERHYIQANMIDAGRSYQAVVEQLKGG